MYKISKEQIAEYWNQAILNETGFPGNIIPEFFSYEDIEIQYRSKDDTTIIKLLQCNLVMDIEDETITFISKGKDYNFFYAY